MPWYADDTNDIDKVEWSINADRDGLDNFQFSTFPKRNSPFVNVWMRVSYRTPDHNVALGECWDTLYTDAGYRCGGYSRNIATSNGITSSYLHPVPVLPAFWFFSSGLLGLIGVARRKKAV
jgi:hypothetical protein